MTSGRATYGSALVLPPSRARSCLEHASLRRQPGRFGTGGRGHGIGTPGGADLDVHRPHHRPRHRCRPPSSTSPPAPLMRTLLPSPPLAVSRIDRPARSDDHVVTGSLVQVSRSLVACNAVAARIPKSIPGIDIARYSRIPSTQTAVRSERYRAPRAGGTGEIIQSPRAAYWYSPAPLGRLHPVGVDVAREICPNLVELRNFKPQRSMTCERVQRRWFALSAARRPSRQPAANSVPPAAEAPRRAQVDSHRQAKRAGLAARVE